MNADLAWNGSTDSSLLTGRVVVDKLGFTQGSDLSEILANFSGDETVSDPSNFANNIKLNVAMQSSQNLNLASSQLSIAGSASLTAQGTAANPVLLGRILLTSGEIFFLGKRFEIAKRHDFVFESCSHRTGRKSSSENNHRAATTSPRASSARSIN